MIGKMESNLPSVFTRELNNPSKFEPQCVKNLSELKTTQQTSFYVQRKKLQLDKFSPRAMNETFMFKTSSTVRNPSINLSEMPGLLQTMP